MAITKRPVGRPRKETYQDTKEPLAQSLLQKVQTELRPNQSYLSLILGLIILLVAGILVFNYFKRAEPSLGPAQQTVNQEEQKAEEPKEDLKDVAPENLPGKYTAKEGDTLFDLAQTYYNDGTQYSKIAEANKLADPNLILIGQELEIPKLERAGPDTSTGGDPNQTIWGEKITGNTYVVVSGDWLSKIAGRSYGDIFAYKRLAEANNIQNPDLIFPGQVIKIPR